MRAELAEAWEEVARLRGENDRFRSAYVETALVAHRSERAPTRIWSVAITMTFSRFWGRSAFGGSLTCAGGGPSSPSGAACPKRGWPERHWPQGSVVYREMRVSAEQARRSA